LRRESFLDKDMRSSMLKMFVLRKISRESTNPYALMKEFGKRRGFLARFGSTDVKNEIYNTVNSLEKSGYISSSQKTENGRVKNYYVLTLKGKRVMASARILFRKHLQALTTLLNK
jgi:DNA-binding PadR family transcriptional regulator